MPHFPPWYALIAALLLSPSAPAAQTVRDDTVFADFEGAAYSGWRTEGTAFGTSPAAGTLPNQMAVGGFVGSGLANSYHGGDSATGKLLSPTFVVSRRFIAFRIGGGGWYGRTGIHLIVDGKIVRSATGPNTSPGGSETLRPSGWDVQEFAGRNAHLEIVDAATGGWGHITVDQITFTDTAPPLAPAVTLDASRTLPAPGRYVNIPVSNEAEKRTITLRGGGAGTGAALQQFTVPLADGTADWWAFVDVGAAKDKPVTVTVDALPETSLGLSSITRANEIAGQETLYREALRGQFHFSARRGWLNDPNGLVYFNGEYHLFFQHCPFSWGDGVKYWGHAVSADLVHWTEVEEALLPDDLGAMWSGSAVVDAGNTSGFGTDGKPALVLIYTAAGKPFTQCIAYSTDGRHFTKYARNPVVKNITDGNRDPRVFWYAATKQWVQALYVAENGAHTIHFLTSPNLRDWKTASVFPGRPGTTFLYECPDIFPLPLDGDKKQPKWVLMGADSQYVIGSFDGTRFSAESSILPGVLGRGFYAPQTFNDAPNDRRIQIGWWRTTTPGMPFNQSMSLPLELKLVTTANGMRLTYAPVGELESLRAKTHTLGPVTVGAAGKPDPLAAVTGELLEIRAEWTPDPAGVVAFTVRGVTVAYDAAKEELTVGDQRAYAPLQKGKQRLTIYADRTGLEVFASDGLCFVPLPVNLAATDTRLSLTVKGEPVTFDRLEVHELKSAWR